MPCDLLATVLAIQKTGAFTSKGKNAANARQYQPCATAHEVEVGCSVSHSSSPTSPSPPPPLSAGVDGNYDYCSTSAPPPPPPPLPLSSSSFSISSSSVPPPSIFHFDSSFWCAGGGGAVEDGGRGGKRNGQEGGQQQQQERSLIGAGGGGGGAPPPPPSMLPSTGVCPSFPRSSLPLPPPPLPPSLSSNNAPATATIQPVGRMMEDRRGRAGGPPFSVLPPPVPLHCLPAPPMAGGCLRQVVPPGTALGILAGGDTEGTATSHSSPPRGGGGGSGRRAGSSDGPPRSKLVGAGSTGVGGNAVSTVYPISSTRSPPHVPPCYVAGAGPPYPSSSTSSSSFSSFAGAPPPVVAGNPVSPTTTTSAMTATAQRGPLLAVGYQDGRVVVQQCRMMAKNSPTSNNHNVSSPSLGGLAVPPILSHGGILSGQPHPPPPSAGGGGGEQQQLSQGGEGIGRTGGSHPTTMSSPPRQRGGGGVPDGPAAPSPSPSPWCTYSLTPTNLLQGTHHMTTALEARLNNPPPGGAGNGNHTNTSTSQKKKSIPTIDPVFYPAKFSPSTETMDRAAAAAVGPVKAIQIVGYGNYHFLLAVAYEKMIVLTVEALKFPLSPADGHLEGGNEGNGFFPSSSSLSSFPFPLLLRRGRVFLSTHYLQQAVQAGIISEIAAGEHGGCQNALADLSATGMLHPLSVHLRSVGNSDVRHSKNTSSRPNHAEHAAHEGSSTGGGEGGSNKGGMGTNNRSQTRSWNNNNNNNNNSSSGGEKTSTPGKTQQKHNAPGSPNANNNSTNHNHHHHNNNNTGRSTSSTTNHAKAPTISQLYSSMMSASQTSSIFISIESIVLSSCGRYLAISLTAPSLCVLLVKLPFLLFFFSIATTTTPRIETGTSGMAKTEDSPSLCAIQRAIHPFPFFSSLPECLLEKESIGGEGGELLGVGGRGRKSWHQQRGTKFSRDRPSIPPPPAFSSFSSSPLSSPRGPGRSGRRSHSPTGLSSTSNNQTRDSKGTGGGKPIDTSRTPPSSGGGGGGGNRKREEGGGARGGRESGGSPIVLDQTTTPSSSRARRGDGENPHHNRDDDRDGGGGDGNRKREEGEKEGKEGDGSRDRSTDFPLLVEPEGLLGASIFHPFAASQNTMIHRKSISALTGGTTSPISNINSPTSLLSSSCTARTPLSTTSLLSPSFSTSSALARTLEGGGGGGAAVVVEEEEERGGEGEGGMPIRLKPSYYCPAVSMMRDSGRHPTQRSTNSPDAFQPFPRSSKPNAHPSSPPLSSCAATPNTASPSLLSSLLPPGFFGVFSECCFLHNPRGEPVQLVVVWVNTTRYDRLFLQTPPVSFEDRWIRMEIEEKEAVMERGAPLARAGEEWNSSCPPEGVTLFNGASYSSMESSLSSNFGGGREEEGKEEDKDEDERIGSGSGRRRGGGSGRTASGHRSNGVSKERNSNNNKRGGGGQGKRNGEIPFIEKGSLPSPGNNNNNTGIHPAEEKEKKGMKRDGRMKAGGQMGRKLWRREMRMERSSAYAAQKGGGGQSPHRSALRLFDGVQRCEAVGRIQIVATTSATVVSASATTSMLPPPPLLALGCLGGTVQVVGVRRVLASVSVLPSSTEDISMGGKAVVGWAGRRRKGAEEEEEEEGRMVDGQMMPSEGIISIVSLSLQVLPQAASTRSSSCTNPHSSLSPFAIPNISLPPSSSFYSSPSFPRVAPSGTPATLLPLLTSGSLRGSSSSSALSSASSGCSSFSSSSCSTRGGKGGRAHRGRRTSHQRRASGRRLKRKSRKMSAVAKRNRCEGGREGRGKHVRVSGDGGISLHPHGTTTTTPSKRPGYFKKKKEESPATTSTPPTDLSPWRKLHLANNAEFCSGLGHSAASSSPSSRPFSHQGKGVECGSPFANQDRHHHDHSNTSSIRNNHNSAKDPHDGRKKFVLVSEASAARSSEEEVGEREKGEDDDEEESEVFGDGEGEQGGAGGTNKGRRGGQENKKQNKKSRRGRGGKDCLRRKSHDSPRQDGAPFLDDFVLLAGMAVGTGNEQDEVGAGEEVHIVAGTAIATAAAATGGGRMVPAPPIFGAASVFVPLSQSTISSSLMTVNACRMAPPFLPNMATTTSHSHRFPPDSYNNHDGGANGWRSTSHGASDEGACSLSSPHRRSFFLSGLPSPVAAALLGDPFPFALLFLDPYATTTITTTTTRGAGAGERSTTTTGREMEEAGIAVGEGGGQGCGTGGGGVTTEGGFLPSLSFSTQKNEHEEGKNGGGSDPTPTRGMPSRWRRQSITSSPPPLPFITILGSTSPVGGVGSGALSGPSYPPPPRRGSTIGTVHNPFLLPGYPSAVFGISSPSSPSPPSSPSSFTTVSVSRQKGHHCCLVWDVHYNVLLQSLPFSLPPLLLGWTPMEEERDPVEVDERKKGRPFGNSNNNTTPSGGSLSPFSPSSSSSSSASAAAAAASSWWINGVGTSPVLLRIPHFAGSGGGMGGRGAGGGSRAASPATAGGGGAWKAQCSTNSGGGSGGRLSFSGAPLGVTVWSGGGSGGGGSPLKIPSSLAATTTTPGPRGKFPFANTTTATATSSTSSAASMMMTTLTNGGGGGGGASLSSISRSGRRGPHGQEMPTFTSGGGGGNKMLNHSSNTHIHNRISHAMKMLTNTSQMTSSGPRCNPYRSNNNTPTNMPGGGGGGGGPTGGGGVPRSTSWGADNAGTLLLGSTGGGEDGYPHPHNGNDEVAWSSELAMTMMTMTTKMKKKMMKDFIPKLEIGRCWAVQHTRRQCVSTFFTPNPAGVTASRSNSATSVPLLGSSSSFSCSSGASSAPSSSSEGGGGGSGRRDDTGEGGIGAKVVTPPWWQASHATSPWPLVYPYLPVPHHQRCAGQLLSLLQTSSLTACAGGFFWVQREEEGEDEERGGGGGKGKEGGGDGGGAGGSTNLGSTTPATGSSLSPCTEFTRRPVGPSFTPTSTSSCATIGTATATGAGGKRVGGGPEPPLGSSCLFSPTPRPSVFPSSSSSVVAGGAGATLPFPTLTGESCPNTTVQGTTVTTTATNNVTRVEDSPPPPTHFQHSASYHHALYSPFSSSSSFRSSSTTTAPVRFRPYFWSFTSLLMCLYPSFLSYFPDIPLYWVAHALHRLPPSARTDSVALMNMYASIIKGMGEGGGGYRCRGGAQQGRRGSRKSGEERKKKKHSSKNSPNKEETTRTLNYRGGGGGGMGERGVSSGIAPSSITSSSAAAVAFSREEESDAYQKNLLHHFHHHHHAGTRSSPPPGGGGAGVPQPFFTSYQYPRKKFEGSEEDGEVEENKRGGGNISFLSPPPPNGGVGNPPPPHCSSTTPHIPHHHRPRTSSGSRTPTLMMNTATLKPRRRSRAPRSKPSGGVQGGGGEKEEKNEEEKGKAWRPPPPPSRRGSGEGTSTHMGRNVEAVSRGERVGCGEDVLIPSALAATGGLPQQRMDSDQRRMDKNYSTGSPARTGTSTPPLITCPTSFCSTGGGNRRRGGGEVNGGGRGGSGTAGNPLCLSPPRSNPLPVLPLTGRAAAVNASDVYPLKWLAYLSQTVSERRVRQSKILEDVVSLHPLHDNNRKRE